MSVQHRHHDGRSLVLDYPLVGSFLLHERVVELCCVLPLDAQRVLPLLEERLENEKVIVLAGLLLRKIDQITDRLVGNRPSILLVFFQSVVILKAFLDVQALVEVFIGAPHHSDLVEVIFVQNAEELYDIAAPQKLMLYQVEWQLNLLVVVPLEKPALFVLQRLSNMRLHGTVACWDRHLELCLFFALCRRG